MKCIVLSVVVIVASLASVTGHAAHTYESEGAREPSAVEVQRAALAYYNIRGDEVRRWKKRAKLQALLPRLEVFYDRRILNEVNIDISERIYVGSSGVTVGPDQGAYKQDANSDQKVGFKAVWYLNELIFNRDQLDISREARSIMHERDALMKEVNLHYHERKRMRGVIRALERGEWVEIPGMKKMKEKNTKHALFLARVRMEEETAQLDGLTGGWFSRRLGR